jgi:hypothetical protein
MTQNTIGDYTAAEVAAMSPDQFLAAQADGFRKMPREEDGSLQQPVTQADVAALYASARNELQEHVTGRPVAAAPPAPQPSGNVWASQMTSGEDFVCPSGQTCRLRKVSPEALLRAGILDRVTRLDGLAAQLVATAEGQPPTKAQMPSTEDLELLLSTINLVVPMALIEPQVWADDAEVPDGVETVIRVSDIDLEDRMAIMEKALGSLRGLDSFRNAR